MPLKFLGLNWINFMNTQDNPGAFPVLFNHSIFSTLIEIGDVTLGSPSR